MFINLAEFALDLLKGAMASVFVCEYICGYILKQQMHAFNHKNICHLEVLLLSVCVCVYLYTGRPLI